MTGTEPEEARDRTLRARNRALLAVFAALALLLYAVTLVRIAGY
jgi:hypothetical protein